MKRCRFRVKLAVVVFRDQITAQLIFTNQGNSPFFLYKPNFAEGGEIEKDLFEVFEGERRLEYVGRLAKYGPPDEEDFVKIAPGEQFKAEISIEQAYEFPEKEGPFRVRYSALNPYPDRDGFVELESNEVSFRRRD